MKRGKRWIPKSTAKIAWGVVSPNFRHFLNKSIAGLRAVRITLTAVSHSPKASSPQGRKDHFRCLSADRMDVPFRTVRLPKMELDRSKSSAECFPPMLAVLSIHSIHTFTAQLTSTNSRTKSVQFPLTCAFRLAAFCRHISFAFSFTQFSVNLE